MKSSNGCWNALLLLTTFGNLLLLLLHQSLLLLLLPRKNDLGSMTSSFLFLIFYFISFVLSSPNPGLAEFNFKRNVDPSLF